MDISNEDFSDEFSIFGVSIDTENVFDKRMCFRILISCCVVTSSYNLSNLSDVARTSVSEEEI